MPLSDTLNALRGMILDCESIPIDSTQRAELFKSYAPNLTEPELEDLIAMQPEMLSIYTRTVFNGEANVLRNHYKITVKFLEENWKNAFGEDFNLFQFVRDIHKQHPWEDNLSHTLAANFRDYIYDISSKFSSANLNDIVELEYFSLLAKRHHSRLTSDAQAKLNALSELTIEQLLEQRVEIQAACKLHCFSTDMVSLYRYFYSNSMTLPEEINQRETHAICSRTPHGRPLWSQLSPSVFKFFDQHKDDSFLVSDLAKVFLSDASPEKSEEELFQEFYQDLSGLLKTYTLIIL